MLKIYGFPTFNLNKVLFTAEEIGLEYEYVALDPTKNEHKTLEHIQRQPLGKIPAIEHNDKAIFESAAICRYLANVGGKLYNGDAMQRAAVDQWMDLIAHHAGRWLGVLFFEEYIKTKLMNMPANEAAIKEAKGFLDQQLPAIDKHLQHNEFFAGDTITIADTFGLAYFHTHEVTSIDFSSYPNITRWYSQMKQRPSFTKALRHFQNN
ncbi:MAG: glutathione S-transferase family protein [Gammaproteobacteria bacterium]|nr:glutathione S-transferase family protein [Gammaproteobacteria bacterium]